MRCPEVFARNQLREFYRGVRAQAMGNAFTAIADDADAVFYNPAGIAYNSGIQLRLVNPKLEISDDNRKVFNDMTDLAKNGFDADALKALFGRNLYFNGTLYPSLLLPHLTLGYYTSVNGHLVLNNLSLPQLDVDYYYDQGFVGGIGFESKGFGRNQFFRYGLTLKVITRRGVSGNIPISTLALNDGSYLKALVSDSATGYGLDLGFQYDIPVTSDLTFTWGTAWHDIGDTRFGSRLSSRIPQSMESNVAMGGAFVYNFTTRNNYDFKVSFEGRHLEHTGEDPRKKVHFGTELALGQLAIQAGLSQLNWTAGATIDFWLLQLAVASYAVENMPFWGMSTERRYTAQLTFKLDASSGKAREKEVDMQRRKRPRLYR